jgi:serine/threonine-protein kinase HipA
MFEPHRDTDFRAIFQRLTGSVDTDPVGLSGVQPKVSAAMWSTPANTTLGPAILKLNPPTGFPRLVENEHFFIRMAVDCGLRAGKARLLHDADGRSALLLDRFDRRRNTRIPQEDACQVAGVFPASKHRIHAETAITTLADACAQGGGSRPTAVLELLRIVVFSWLIGNGHLRGKNLSIFAPQGFWRPTPAYDLLTTQPYTGWKDPMALSLCGRADRLDRSHFVEAATRMGIRARATSRMIDSIVDAADDWPDRLRGDRFHCTAHRTADQHAADSDQDVEVNNLEREPKTAARSWNRDVPSRRSRSAQESCRGVVGRTAIPTRRRARC